MPEWASHLITAVLSAFVAGGGVAAVFKGYLSVRSQRDTTARQVKVDEITVLHREIDDLRRDRDAGRVELAETRRDVGKLKDDHTNCLIETERLRGEIGQLRAELKQLRGS